MFLNKKFILNWVAPILVASIIFIFVRPALAQIMTVEELSRYVLENDVTVGEETVEGFRQVYYMLSEEKIFVTSGKDNSRNPVVNKEYMAWVTEVNGAGGQIFLYHIPTGITTSITGSSTNLNPRVSDTGKVVWERWLDERWQIFLYDGISVRQLTDGDVSVSADISGDQVVFVRQDKDKNWLTVRLDLSARSATVIAEGLQYKTPSFFEGNVVYDFGAGIKGDREAQKLREQRILDSQRQAEERSRREAENQLQAEEQRLRDEEIAREREAQALLNEALLEESLLDSAVQIISNIVESIIDIFVEESPALIGDITVSSTEPIVSNLEGFVSGEETPSSTEVILIPVKENTPPVEILPTKPTSTTEQILIKSTSTESVLIEPILIEPVSEELPIINESLPEKSVPVEQAPTETTSAKPINETVKEVIVTDNTKYFTEVGKPKTVTEADIVEELLSVPMVNEEVPVMPAETTTSVLVP
ncbi:MAG: hypothetical protein Q8O88_06170 [bacterium]|nr:hypothetical protein [bacterium]